MKLVEKNFLLYKLLNSSFTGLSIGIVFIIYKPLDPSVYSIGGMVMTILMLVVAAFYKRLLNIKNFFQISILVEVIMLLTLIVFLIFDAGLTVALLIFCGYQLTFIFGGYLVRAETLVAHDKHLLSKIDVLKQIGYLVGLGLSFLFYKSLEYGFEISDDYDRIRILHYFLIALQSTIIFLVFRSFKK
jgi:putative membrane protein